MAKVAIEDLSGVSTPVTSNPYDGLIQATDNDPKKMQERYQLHRVTRNLRQKADILADNFSGWVLDEHLTRLDGPQRDTNYRDPRNCLVFWARPPQKVKNLVQIIQQKLKDAAPNLWLMPISNLHMTALEVTHSKTEAEIDDLVSTLKPSAKSITDMNSLDNRRPRLIKPMLSFDSAALALSFVPAADLYTQVTNTGVHVGSRYVVPSAHLTIARFNSPNPFEGDPLDASVSLDIQTRRRWLSEVEMINKWLEAEFWPDGHGRIRPGGEWIVGEEKGLDFRKGTLWYGGQLTHAAAVLASQAAEQKSREIGVPMNIAIVDASLYLLHFVRLPGAKLTSVDIAINKAFTAAGHKVPTSAYKQQVTPGGVAYGLATAGSNHGRFTYVGGGVPFVVDGEVVGAIGCSTGTPAQDEEVAKAGVNAVLAAAAASGTLKSKL
ncbi:hypothetical protein DV738_g175, partial [Chaetothyriales sp. CBS 135597]